VQGVRYTLGPPEDPPAIGEAVQLRHQGGYLLVLCREEDWRPLGFVALRPRLGPHTARLVQTCRRLGVRVEMLQAGAPEAAQAVARRAEVPLAASRDAVAVIRDRQQAGFHVLFVSDSAQAAPAFAACDLAVGLQPPTGDFPARADLLAPDLGAVTAVLEAGSLRDQAVREAVAFSAGANVFGAVWGLRGLPGIERASRGVYVSALAALADGWLHLQGGKRPGPGSGPAP
jgi:cation transport ATPase